jgi:sugar/nucleoside kinase (ribokinase family)
VPTLCLGEAIVDLVCERPVTDPAEADTFRPHFGGAAGNVAYTAAATGADVALAGGAGDDAWGRWLRARLERVGVALRWFELVDGLATPLALVTTDAEGEPSFSIYGDGIAATIEALSGRVDEAVEASDALFFGTNTMVGEAERALTMVARERALALDRPVVFDPNLRPARWRTSAEAAAAANAAVPGAFLVRTNRAEAEAMTGEPDPERAAAALLAGGARLVVVTLGADGAVLRGDLESDVPGVRARVRSTVGAGDALMGVLLGRLSLAGFHVPALAAALPEAVAEAARATERWGAVE